jgi:hypothetical protein
MHDWTLERAVCSAFLGRGGLPTYRIIIVQIIAHSHRSRHGLLVISPLSEKATATDGVRKARNAVWAIDRDIHDLSRVLSTPRDVYSGGSIESS